MGDRHVTGRGRLMDQELASVEIDGSRDGVMASGPD